MGIICLIMLFDPLKPAGYDAQGWHPPRGMSLYPLEIDCRPIGREWAFGNVCSSFWRLYVNNRDSACLELSDGRAYPLTAHRVHLIPAWVRFNCRNEAPLDHFYVHFGLMGLPSVLLRQVFASPVMVGTARSFQPMLNHLRRRPWRNDPFSTLCLTQSLIYLAISRAWRQLKPDHAAACRDFLRVSRPMSAVLSHIEQHLGGPLHNAELADCCHLSRDHFVRRFAQEIGQAPAHYIRERRVARAAQLLLFSHSSIDEIARQTGFSDRFHFTRIFGRIMGTSPAAYRRAEHALAGRK